MDDPAIIVYSRRIAKALMPESYEMDPIGAGESVLNKWDALLIDYYGVKLPWMDRILDTCASILMIEDGNNLELERDIDDVELDDEVYEEVFNEIAKDTPWFPKLYSIIMEHSGPYPVEKSSQEPRGDSYASDDDVDMQEGKPAAEYVAAALLANSPPAPPASAAQSSSSTPKLKDTPSSLSAARSKVRHQNKYDKTQITLGVFNELFRRSVFRRAYEENDLVR